MNYIIGLNFCEYICKSCCSTINAIISKHFHFPCVYANCEIARSNAIARHRAACKMPNGSRNKNILFPKSRAGRSVCTPKVDYSAPEIRTFAR